MKEYIMRYENEYLQLLPDKMQELIRCNECKFFKKEDYWVDIGHGAKMLAGGDVPTCKKWGNGDCHTKEDGYCYLAERKEEI